MFRPLVFCVAVQVVALRSSNYSVKRTPVHRFRFPKLCGRRRLLQALGEWGYGSEPVDNPACALHCRLRVHTSTATTSWAAGGWPADGRRVQRKSGCVGQVLYVPPSNFRGRRLIRLQYPDPRFRQALHRSKELPRHMSCACSPCRCKGGHRPLLGICSRSVQHLAGWSWGRVQS